jgi:hypothetical protein
VDPGLWLFRRVCGQVVQRDPATGIDLPVPYATVEVFDTVCDYWGFFPEPWPWGWLFPVSCRRELVTTVQTDVCGDFCFWIPAFEIEWILRWREERICFPEVFTRPTVADLVTAPSAQGTAPQAAAHVERLRVGGDLEAALGARAGAVLSAARSSGGFGDDVTQLASLLRAPAFARQVTRRWRHAPQARPPIPGRRPRSTLAGTTVLSRAASMSSYPSGMSSSRCLT